MGWQSILVGAFAVGIGLLALAGRSPTNPPDLAVAAWFVILGSSAFFLTEQHCDTKIVQYLLPTVKSRRRRFVTLRLLGILLGIIGLVLLVGSLLGRW
jgi:uncharacterized SAM-binding protein YcdF (DUF218 family)